MSKGKSVICQTAHDNKALIWALLDHASTCFEELGLFLKLQLYQEDINESAVCFSNNSDHCDKITQYSQEDINESAVCFSNNSDHCDKITQYFY